MWLLMALGASWVQAGDGDVVNPHRSVMAPWALSPPVISRRCRIGSQTTVAPKRSDGGKVAGTMDQAPHSGGATVKWAVTLLSALTIKPATALVPVTSPVHESKA